MIQVHRSAGQQPEWPAAGSGSHLGVIRHLHQDIGARRWVPAVAIILDVLVLTAFIVVKAGQDVLTLTVAAALSLTIFLGQWWAVRRRDQNAETHEGQQSHP
ncbi:hypothetical protein GU243_08650 [Pseudarthrobacter psychrotolerans]|uniref:Uncharacterized protein n=1 Tax=Pseudarthrobacter psychrotolerans TaxID=2697569 RepID=A0A6P1NKC2_9MICC|nr:hypothetical protein [Pseudarthrobacter psychrotolerans]QHK19788.1 hypothetical protein GU243_08650 [Pseudarthrobacter psychrotolerans]